MKSTPRLKHFRLLGQFKEAREILDEVLSQPDLFDVDSSRQQRIKVQRETRSIPVRAKQRRADLPDQPDRDVLGSRWTPLADRLPRLKRFLERVAQQEGALLGRARVVNLPAGQRVYPHIDRGDYYQQLDRHHLVLRSTAGSWLKSGDEEMRLQTGELWWFDNRAMHEAFNDGDEDRIHVIFDLLPLARAHLLEPAARADADIPVNPTAGLPVGIHRLNLPGCLPVQLIVPSSPRDATALVAVHGMSRDVDTISASLAERAEALGRWVIVPLFSLEHYPKYRLGRCPDQADAALLRTLREIGQRTGLELRRFDLAGFSAGAQFAHRFAMLYPNRIRGLTLSSAGWYTTPDVRREHPYPVGLSALDLRAKLMHANLRAFLALPITVAVGELDCEADASTRSDPLIDSLQGSHRLDRARSYAHALDRAAKELGVRTCIRLRTLPGANHDFKSCADAGLANLMLDSAFARDTVLEDRRRDAVFPAEALQA